MWKASAGHQIVAAQDQEDDDWETDPDFVNDVTEQEQRWGSKTIAGSGRTADIGTAEPSNLRAKFENFAKNASEDDQKRTAEQKRIHEEKDRLDREQAAKKSTFESTQEDSKPAQRRVNIDTGRTGGIGSAISAFNQQAQSPTTETPVQRKSPIKLPKQPEAQPVIQPSDVIPTQHAQPAVPPSAAFTNDFVPEPVVEQPVEQDAIVNPPDEQLYSNVEQVTSNKTAEKRNEQPPQSPVEEQSPAAATIEESEPIYQNQETLYQDDLTEYIDDTGVKAVALYDYQAAADDEISFDPDDLITHIEQIDEGWWRGLCKSKYGLFPANYVQLQQ